VTDTHRALIPTCRHSLKVKVLLGDVIARAKLSVSLSSCLACTANAGYIVRISSAANLITILTNFGGYKTFRHWLAKYCQGGIPGGVEAYVNNVQMQ